MFLMLSTSIHYDDPAASIALALYVIDEFRIKKTRAFEIIEEVSLAVSKWRSVATQFGLTTREIERMASAFDHEELGKL